MHIYAQMVYSDASKEEKTEIQPVELYGEQKASDRIRRRNRGRASVS